MIRSSQDIKVGQFYKSLAAEGYYYLGIKCGKGKRLVVINLTESEVNCKCNALFPDERVMYIEWKFRPCSQKQVIKFAVK